VALRQTTVALVNDRGRRKPWASRLRPRGCAFPRPCESWCAKTALAPVISVLSVFFSANSARPNPIPTLPGVAQLPVSHAGAQAREIARRGWGGDLVRVLPKTKIPRAKAGAIPDGPVPRAVAEIKAAVPEMRDHRRVRRRVHRPRTLRRAPAAKRSADATRASSRSTTTPPRGASRMPWCNAPRAPTSCPAT